MVISSVYEKVNAIVRTAIQNTPACLRTMEKLHARTAADETRWMPPPHRLFDCFTNVLSESFLFFFRTYDAAYE